MAHRPFEIDRGIRKGIWMPEKKKTFVFVPGAWCGAWCWKPVCERLAGHDVHPLTLTGLGERVHLASDAVGLETHIADICNAIHYSELEEVILVVHSVGGMAAAVVDRMPERLVHVVFVDAMLPVSGECAMDLVSPEESARLAAIRQTSHVLPVPESVHFATEGMMHWFTSLMTPQPIRPLIEPVILAHPLGNGVPVTYIACRPARVPGVACAADRARTIPSSRVIEVTAGHNIQLSRPDFIADMLLDIAESY